MKRSFPTVFLPLLAALLLASPGCRKQEVPKSDQVAERLGRDEAVYVQKPGAAPGETVLAMDLGQLVRPDAVGQFTALEHLPPVRQYRTATCWAFAAASLLESELRRQGKAPVKLSEMFIVYWEYVEKARRFLRERGRSFLGQGSEPDSALERVAQYGVVRETDFPGLPAGRTEHDHGPLYREFVEVLEGLRARGEWDEARGLAAVRGVLDRHLGRPPGTITVDGRAMTPTEFLTGALGLRPADYAAFVSFAYLPFYVRGEFRVPDNWRRAATYYNLPLYEFDLTLLRALRRGYTATLAVDFTEAGYDPNAGVAVIPTFDLPRNFIDQSSREFRFVSGTTADDHAVHCVGYKEGKDIWFLVKDSWENAYASGHPGYYFYRDDYVRLKCLMFLVHKDAVKETLAKFH